MRRLLSSDDIVIAVEATQRLIKLGRSLRRSLATVLDELSCVLSRNGL